LKQKYSDVLQEIEATVAEVCTEVENERENLAKEMTSVTEDIENCMISFLKCKCFFLGNAGRGFY
jgi:hypothetical protein